MKRRTNDTESAYKLYKNLFECIKLRSKQNYYYEKLLRFKYNQKKIMDSDEKTDLESDIKVIKPSSKNYN